MKGFVDIFILLKTDALVNLLYCLSCVLQYSGFKDI